MKLNLNKFLFSISYALDLAESEIFDVSNFHSKRVAYVAVRIAELLKFSDEELFDLYSYALLHDNGLIEAFQLQKNKENKQIIDESLIDHCSIGERNISDFPFLSANKNIIKYHHEHYDGSGFFGIKGDDIPLMSQIIFLADTVDSKFNLKKVNYDLKESIDNYIDSQRDKLFSNKLVDVFLELSNNFTFWGELEYFYTVQSPDKLLPSYDVEISVDEFFSITQVLSNLIDSKSKFTYEHSRELANKTKEFIEHFNYDEEKQKKLLISANLHDIGKLATPISILEKNGALTNEELFEIKKHAYFTYNILASLDFCDDILSWASHHHEKPDGSGYPFGLDKNQLSFEARIISCLDFYQALTEERPYRKALNHEDSIDIMKKNLKDFDSDLVIIDKINQVFAS